MWAPSGGRCGIGVVIHEAGHRCAAVVRFSTFERQLLQLGGKDTIGRAIQLGVQCCTPRWRAAITTLLHRAMRAPIFPVDLSCGWITYSGDAPQPLPRLDKVQGYLWGLSGAPSTERERERGNPHQCGPKISVVVRSQPRTTGACSLGIRSSSQSRGSATKKGIAPRSPPDRDFQAAQ